MIKRLFKYKKYKDILNFKAWEVMLSFVVSIALCLFLYIIGFYDDFILNIPLISNVLLYIIAGLIGFLGISITCVAIIISMFDKNKSKLIDEVNQTDDGIITFLACYEFVALLIGLEIVFLVALIILMNSTLPLMGFCGFYPLVFITLYSIIFILFYTIALISLLINLYKVSMDYQDLKPTKRTLLEEANELRIEFLLEYMISSGSVTADEIINLLNDFIEKYDVDESIKKYLKDMYNE